MARLRSQGPVMTAMNGLSPISNRKRRAASPVPPSSPTKDKTSTTKSKGQPLPSALTKSASKGKKRVRFSDPGPEATCSSSTGLTPFIKRTSLTQGMDRPGPTTPRLLARPPKRRVSMSDATQSSSSELGTATNPIEVHNFTPLRQILTPRTRRQIKRNHLSEEMNSISAEKQSVAKLQQEVQSLRDELILAKQLGKEPTAADCEGNAQRIQDLEEEIVALKRERSTSVDPDLSLVADTTFIADMDDEVDLVRSESGYGTASASTNSSPIVSTEDVYMDVPSSPSPSPDFENQGRAATTRVVMKTGESQTDISSQGLNTLYSFARAQTKCLTRARLELERIYPGETALSLDSGDAKPLLDNMLSRLRDSQSQLKTCRHSLAASQVQESNLRAKFNTSLKQLEEARSAHAKLLADNQKSTSSKITSADDTIAKLQVEVQNHERSHSSLTAALDKYREEVNDLESLIQTLEIEHAGTIAKLQSEQKEALETSTSEAAQKSKQEMDEAVADLECMVAAETRGRREAEGECDELSLKAKEAKEREREAKAALYEKQGIVRELEGKIDGMQTAWEKEVGGLNARIGRLCADVANKTTELRRAEDEIRRLVGCVQEEKEAGRRGIERMKAEVEKCRDGVEQIGSDMEKDGVSRSERVVSALGLLTPTVEGGRFRDVDMGESESVDGQVEVARGKARRRKVDSGIGILLEDEEE